MKKTKEKKKSTRRSRTKYPGLTKEVTSRVRREFLDMDYIDKLNEEEKKWLNNFMEGHLHANINKENRKMFKRKKDRKAVYDANNARNRDTTAITKQSGYLLNYGNMSIVIEENQEVKKDGYEDAVIEVLDNKLKK